jgi:17beta-estradiol 17-dehydrogenase / very-long-chain 3-oxoacyl-CoA reductase
MATEMARQGNNVVLMSRTAAKLEEKAAAIRTQYPKVEVKIFAVDFMNIGDKKQRSDIQAFLAPLEVGVLVNNVGESYANPMYFDELSDEAVEKLTVLNVESTMWMTRIVLPQMLKAKKGAIINISSAAGVLTSPLLSQYGGAKGNVAQFSRALHYELAPRGIHVQCQVPLYVTTKLAKLRHSSWSVATEKQYARAAIKAIGSGVVVSPYWSHALQMNVFSSLPEWLLAWGTTQMHLGIRKAAQKKAADNAAKEGAAKKD